jgi:hypothetical protein
VQKAVGVLTCTACGQTKALTAFVAIKQSRDGYYGACRACRADHARARYQTIRGSERPKSNAHSAIVVNASRPARKAADGAAADLLSGAGGNRLLPAVLACSERLVAQSDRDQSDSVCQRKT